jgi:acetyl esterase/lipase
MDVYHPRAGISGQVPAILYVHGGGWTSGDKSGAALWAGLLARQGYLVASINYRLAPQYKWPAQIEDTKCAIRYLRASAAKYNIDADRIGAIGDCAGGHLVSLLGLTGPDTGFEGSGGYPEQSSAVQAVVDMYGPTDFTSADLKAESFRIAQILGIPLAQAPAVLRKASPVTYAKKDAPPFFILQGDSDRLVLPSQSQVLYQHLKDAGADVDLLMVKNAGHGFVPSGGEIDPNLLVIGQRIVSFFARTLKGQAAGG